jgi:hypothetical protein
MTKDGKCNMSCVFAHLTLFFLQKWEFVLLAACVDLRLGVK